MRPPALHRAPRLIALAALLFTTSALLAQHPAHSVPLRPIQIENGKLLGVLTADRKIVAYKGIPYAQPPIDELRWQPPQPIGKWKKVLYARDFGPHCIQSGAAIGVFRDPGPSEDCLTLNLWAPAPSAKSARHPGPGLPVMVWIHGGTFSAGGSSEQLQDGEALARRGVIVVNMNYRLGIFGFLALPELTEESTHHTSGNYGLMDQAAALAWVRRNIAAFGGDPANVTLFGESSGSLSVCAQMASPVSNTLFARAIGQSGGFFPAWLPMPQRQQAEPINAGWAARAFGSNKLFYLRQLPADEIMEAANSRTQPAPRFGPIVDGYFLPDSLPHLYADGKQAHIPLLAGWNADEQHPADPPTGDAFYSQLRDEFGARAKDALLLYPITTDADLLRSADDFAGDRFLAYGAWAWIESHSRTGDAPVYRYFFDLPSPGDRNHPASLGAFHTDDVDYVFGTLSLRPGITLRPEDRALSDLMQQYWVNFARTGDPNAPGLPPWPSYNNAVGTTHAANSLQTAAQLAAAPSIAANQPTGSSQQTGPTQIRTAGIAQPSDFPVMHLDATPAAKPDTLRPRYLFLDQFWAPH